MPKTNKMTVSDLIELLQEFPKDAEVKVTYDYGDRGHTEVAPTIKSLKL